MAYVFVACDRYNNHINISQILVNNLLNSFTILKYFLNLNIFSTGLATVLISRRLFFRLYILGLNRFHNEK